MNALLSHFVRLCLLRSAPQQLPASPVLFWLALIANLIASVLLAGAWAGVFVALLAGLADSLLMLLLLWLALRWQRHGGRFLQSATAFFGASTLLTLVMIPLLALSGAQEDGESLTGLALIPRLAWLIWYLVVFGHILRHSFDTSLSLGIALAVAYTLVSYQVISLLFPTV